MHHCLRVRVPQLARMLRHNERVWPRVQHIAALVDIIRIEIVRLTADNRIYPRRIRWHGHLGEAQQCVLVADNLCWWILASVDLNHRLAGRPLDETVRVTLKVVPALRPAGTAETRTRMFEKLKIAYDSPQPKGNSVL